MGAVLGALLTLAAIAEATDFYRSVGIVGFTEQRLVAILGIALVLVFVCYPATRNAPRRRIPWYDRLGIAVSLVVCGWVTWHYEAIFNSPYDRPPELVAAAVVIVALVAEGLRRTSGNVLVIFMLLFVLFGLFGHFVPGQFEGRYVPVERMFTYIALDPNGLVGAPMVVSATIVVSFVYFGHLLDASGGSSFFTDISLALMGRHRGGSSKIAVVASGLFGSISGSAVSNVVSTGVITIPLMKRGGYPPAVAAAIEAVASTGGQLMPPVMGAAAFLMAEFLQISYGIVVVAAIVPALLYYAALFIAADLFAARHGIGRVREDMIPNGWSVLKAGWLFCLPFVVLIVALFRWNMQPDTSALLAAVVVVCVGVLFGYKGTRMSILSVLKCLSSTGISVTQIIMIAAMAGIVIGVLNITGLGFALTQALIAMAAGNLFVVLILAAFVSIILGMGMPTIGVYLLLATLLTPSLTELGVEPLRAHLFALYFGMLSMITPPVAVAAYAAATIARSDPMRSGFEAVKFGWAAYLVPFLIVLAPEIVLEGSPVGIATAILTCLGGIWLISAGIHGYLLRPMAWASRALAVVAGLLLFLPASVLPGGIWTDAVGLVLAAGLVGVDYRAARKMAAPTAPPSCV